MKVEFTITLKDYKNALRLHRRQKLSRRIFAWIWPSLVLVSVVAFTAGAAMDNVALVTHSVAVGAGACAASVAVPILRFLNIRRGYKQMYPPTRTSPLSSIEIDEKEIVEINPGTAEVRLLWNGVLDFVQGEEVTMIYISTHRFFLFPTTAMTVAQRTELNELVARHVVKGQTC